MKRFILAHALAAIVFTSFFCVATANADPLPGEIAKFIQLPLNGGLPIPLTPGSIPPGAVSGAQQPFPGHDELSTAWRVQPGAFSGQFMADDFSDNVSGDLVHIQWWGSYMSQHQNIADQFLISIESDVPQSPDNPFSHPGTPLLNQIVTRGALFPQSGTFTEVPVAIGPGSPDGNLFQYNAELAIPFPEKAGEIYWLKIVALDPAHSPTDPASVQWGWHNRDWGLKDNLAAPVLPGERDISGGVIPGLPVWHFQDDAVSGGVGILLSAAGGLPLVDQGGFKPENYHAPFDVPTVYDGLSKDLAFVLYTRVPEPGSIVMLAMGGGALAFVGLRRRS
jgi:hypothetical protein